MHKGCYVKPFVIALASFGIMLPGTAAFGYVNMTQAQYNAMVKKDPSYRYTVLNQSSHGKARGVYTSRRNYGSLPLSRPATGNKVFVFSPSALAWAVYDGDGQRVRVGPASGGRSYCPDVGRGCRTPQGVFRVYSKAGPDYRSTKFPIPYGGAPMPWAMFFHGGYAIHGSYDVPGYNASHGCIRVVPSDAQWLNNNFLSRGSTVIVQPYRS